MLRFRTPSLLIATLVTASLAASPVHAQVVGYLAADTIHWALDQGASGSAEAVGGRVSLGTHLNSRFGGEIRAAGLGSDSLDGESVSLDSAVGVYAKAVHPVTRHIRAYALAGAAQVEIGQGDRSHKESGFSWGVGIELDADTGGKWAIRLDHMRYLDTPDATLEATGLGVVYRF